MANKPNILLIWTDQQRSDTLSCYGNDCVQAPNLNRLAEESFVFRNAYCTQPVCSPSRGSILTGLWPHAHGVTNNNEPLAENIPTLAELLPDTYDCAYYGKWHLGNELSPQHGFADWRSMEDAAYRPYLKEEEKDKRSDYFHFLIENGFYPDSMATDGTPVFSRPYAASLAEPYTKPSFLAREAEYYIRERDDERPFFLSVNFLEPHPPYVGPLNNLYEPEEIPVGESFLIPPNEGCAQRRELTHKKSFKLYEKNLEKNRMIARIDSDWEWRRIKANYYGLITLVDRAVGRILRALEESEKSGDTIVIFTSDHGDMMGDHGWIEKFVLYEEAVKVPLLIRVPWLGRKHRMIDGRVSLVDLAPTLLDLVEVEQPETIQGSSRAGVLRGSETLEGNDVFIEWNVAQGKTNRARTIIADDRWKLNLYTHDNCELFDLQNDPHEMTNLFNDPDQRPRIEALAERLLKWQRQTGDHLDLPATS